MNLKVLYNHERDGHANHTIRSNEKAFGTKNFSFLT